MPLEQVAVLDELAKVENEARPVKQAHGENKGKQDVQDQLAKGANVDLEVLQESVVLRVQLVQPVLQEVEAHQDLEANVENVERQDVQVISYIRHLKKYYIYFFHIIHITHISFAYIPVRQDRTHSHKEWAT